MKHSKENPQNKSELDQQFDGRESAVIREAKFFEPYKEELRELFRMLDKADRWSDDPTDSNFLTCLRSLIGSGHGNAEEKDQFSDEQFESVKPIFDHLGMMNEHLPPAEINFDQTVVFGGRMGANYRRTDLINKAMDEGMDLGQVNFLYGQRPREKADGTSDELISTQGRFGGYDLTSNPWFENYLMDALDSKDPWKMTETEFGRIALNKIMGSELRPSKIHLPIVSVNGVDTVFASKLPDVPSRDVLDYDYTTKNGVGITLINSAAVSRGDRPSRPKTKSTVGEWLERRAPIQNAKVLLVTGNPHALRQTQAAYQILQEYGRGDVELVIAATAPPANTPIQTYLGEVAALILKDVEQNYNEIVT